MPFLIKGVAPTNRVATTKPGVTRWSRLEPRPDSADIRAGLEARVADPLWLLYRQWAFREWEGEDAGTPISASLTGEVARMSRYHPGPFGANASTRAVDFDHQTVPLEVVVEAEGAVEDQPRVSLAFGLHLTRKLEAAGLGVVVPELQQDFPLSLKPMAPPEADQSGAEWTTMLAGKGIDGMAVAADWASHRAGSGVVSGLPLATRLSLTTANATLLDQVATEWMAWMEGAVYAAPGEQASAWQPSRQEYALGLAGETDLGSVVLEAGEYADGHLDWHSFVASAGPDIGVPSAAASVTETLPPMIPSPVRYPGMPAERYWELEDSTVNFGALTGGRTDLTRTLLAEFGLVYGTDWFLIPVEMAVGSVYRVAQLDVTDTFGIVSNIGPSRSPGGTTPWEMFDLGTKGRGADRMRDLFFLAPSIPWRLEGDPIEEVHLLRDETANLAWGVEHAVPGAMGEPYERHIEASLIPLRQRLDVDPGDAEIVYRLATPVPVNWLPFTTVPMGPVNDGFSVALERRRLIQILEDGSTTDGHPKGLLLRSDPSVPVSNDTLRIEEEEIPRDGAKVTRSFQYARWIDGSSFLWLGRTKRSGRGMGSSTLRWDVAERASR